MTSFYFSYQNTSVCCFLVQIKATIVYQTLAEYSNLNKKAKTNRILVVVVKYRHRENGLGQSTPLITIVGTNKEY